MTTHDTSITVTRAIDASAKTIFDLLTLRERHREFDGSGTVRSDDRSQRIQQVGDTFVMNMYAESQGGDYQMRNHVTLTYDWSKVQDPQLAAVFPAIAESSLEQSLNLLSAAVSDA